MTTRFSMLFISAMLLLASVGCAKPQPTKEEMREALESVQRDWKPQPKRQSPADKAREGLGRGWPAPEKGKDDRIPVEPDPPKPTE